MTRRFFAIFLFAVMASTSTVRADEFSSQFEPTRPPVTTPTFHFQDSSGRTVDLKDFRGRYVLLNVWATWCAPCVREMPGLDALQEKIDSRRLSIVAMSEDREGLAAATNFYQRHDLHHLPVFVDTTGRAPAIFHISGLPTTLLIDPNGMEIGRVEGDADWTSSHTIAFLEKQMDRPLLIK